MWHGGSLKIGAFCENMTRLELNLFMRHKVWIKVVLGKILEAYSKNTPHNKQEDLFIEILKV